MGYIFPTPAGPASFVLVSDTPHNSPLPLCLNPNPILTPSHVSNITYSESIHYFTPKENGHFAIFSAIFAFAMLGLYYLNPNVFIRRRKCPYGCLLQLDEDLMRLHGWSEELLEALREMHGIKKSNRHGGEKDGWERATEKVREKYRDLGPSVKRV